MRYSVTKFSRLVSSKAAELDSNIPSYVVRNVQLSNFTVVHTISFPKSFLWAVDGWRMELWSFLEPTL